MRKRGSDCLPSTASSCSSSTVRPREALSSLAADPQNPTKLTALMVCMPQTKRPFGANVAAEKRQELKNSGRHPPFAAGLPSPCLRLAFVLLRCSTAWAARRPLSIPSRPVGAFKEPLYFCKTGTGPSDGSTWPRQALTHAPSRE